MPAHADNRVFLPRLPEGVTDEALRSHFARFGEISDVYIPIHPATGKPKGMAFVTFANSEHAAAAMEQAEQEINGEACEVVKAAPRPDRRGGGGPMRRDPEVADPYLAGFMHAQRMILGGAVPPPIVVTKERDRQRLDTRPRIFVRDVPDTFEDAVLQRHFEQFGEVTDLYQPEHKSPGVEGKKKGIAYVTYRTEQHLSACLAQGEKQFVDGAELTVTKADARREKERPGAAGWVGGYVQTQRSRSPPRRHDFGGSAYGGGGGGGSGRSSSTAQNNRIFVGGISSELSSDDVSEHFRKHGGEITDIYFPRDVRSGSKRGFCYITFQETLAVHRGQC
jgi:RNA recognition motif-containing protein